MSCTCYPLFFPSSIIKLIQDYSDRSYLSLLYYQLEAGISLSQKEEGFREGISLNNPLPCKRLGGEIIQLLERLLIRTKEVLHSLSLELDREKKNLVMSDCTLIKLQRPQVMYKRNYLVMLINLEEEVIACSLLGKKSSSHEVETLAHEVENSLSSLVERCIDILNTS